MKKIHDKDVEPSSGSVPPTLLTAARLFLDWLIERGILPSGEKQAKPSGQESGK